MAKGTPAKKQATNEQVALQTAISGAIMTATMVTADLVLAPDAYKIESAKESLLLGGIITGVMTLGAVAMNMVLED